jgi:hypothetical protein
VFLNDANVALIEDFEMNCALRLAVSSVLFAAVSSAAFAQTEATAGPESRSVDPAALARAQTKFSRAFALSSRFEQSANAQGYANANWRQDLIANLMKLGDDEFDRVAAAPSFGEALSIARNGAVDSAPGAHEKSLGTTTSDLVYVPINPCRILDTRQGTGNTIAAGATNTYVYSANNPGAGGCLVAGQVPSPSVIPAAEAVNVTIDETGITGFQPGSFLAIFPQGGTLGSSFMNFGPSQIIANAGVISINPTNGQFSVKVSATANVLIDVFGVFVPPQTTALDCVDTTKVTGNIAGSGNLTLLAAACPASYTPVSGGCFGGSQSSRSLEEATFNVNGQWFCRWQDFSGSSYELAATTHCCRVPGR